MDQRSRHSDVIVIGGGTIGLFAAMSLAESGRSVMILDRSAAWSEASGANAGSLAVQNKLLPLIPYTIAAHELWQGMSTRLKRDVEYHRTGGYKVATTDQEIERLRDSADGQQAQGLAATWMDTQNVREELPWLSHDVLAATYCPLDGYANPLRLGPALLRQLHHLGVRIVNHAEVTDLTEGNTVFVTTSKGTFTGSDLLITAGAWSAKITALLGVRLPIALDVNMISVTEPAVPTIASIVTHARGILTLKQVSNGSCLIGGGWQGIGSLDDNRKELDFTQLIHNLRLATRIVPGLARLNILRSWAGYEGVTPDSLPILGPLHGGHNVYVAACARGGFTLGPILGRLIGDVIMGAVPTMPVDIFNPGRFENG